MLNEENLCPRCMENSLHQEKTRNALSRMDNRTLICSACGLWEAIHLKRENRFGEYWVMYFPVFYPGGWGIFRGAELEGSRRTYEDAVALAKELSKKEEIQYEN